MIIDVIQIRLLSWDETRLLCLQSQSPDIYSDTSSRSARPLSLCAQLHKWAGTARSLKLDGPLDATVVHIPLQTRRHTSYQEPWAFSLHYVCEQFPENQDGGSD